MNVFAPLTANSTRNRFDVLTTTIRLAAIHAYPSPVAHGFKNAPINRACIAYPNGSTAHRASETAVSFDYNGGATILSSWCLVANTTTGRFGSQRVGVRQNGSSVRQRLYPARSGRSAAEMAIAKPTFEPRSRIARS